MKSSSKAIGTIILIGTLLTAWWGFLCPKYIEAENPYWTTVDKTSYVTSFGGNAAGDRRYYRMDVGIFLAGEVVIWGSLWAGYFLLTGCRTREDQR
ncbi:hypothetical protein ACFQY0_18655 [Haloferula chungangensis]|uniref:Cobalamin transport operon protein n=1 Tax=Haloferula chungangensis TaxID=1048331 RepID=A0ABW2LCI2_9BACT